MERSAGNRRGGILLALGAAAPFFLALVAHAVGRPPTPMANAAVRAGLAFDQYLVDLGEAPPSEQVSARFRFTNTGAVPVTVKDLQPSCGCLTPQLRKKTFQPGESSDLVLRVQTANQELGPKEYRLKVNYQDVQPREASLVFRVVLPDNQVTIRPRALIFYQLGDKPTSQELIVTDRRAQALDVQGARCSLDLADVELLPSDRDEHGFRRLHIKITVAGNIPAGRHQGVVTVFTNDPAYPQLRVPLIVEGPPSRIAAGKARRRSVE